MKAACGSGTRPAACSCSRAVIRSTPGANPLSAPELGEPEAVLDSVLARVRLPGGERVYAQRGLALRVNPENRLLLAMLGFAPTDAADYAARIRPELSKQRLLAGATGR